MRSVRSILQLTARLALVATCAAALACHGDAGGASGATTKTIGVTLLTREHEFYRELEAGLRQSADQHHYKLIVTSGDFDLAKQQSQIDNFIVQHVDAIIVCPVDSKGIAPAIKKATAAGIPVFTADIAAQGAPVVSHVASDNIAGGKLAAQYIAKALGGKGQVGLIGEPEVQSTIDREAGFRQALKAYPGLTLVSSLNGEGVRDRALKAADDMLQAHPEIDAIFAINDESALGVLSSAESRHDDSLVIVGYDATPEAQRAIAGHTPLKADVAQQPRVIGTETIDAIAQHFAGKTPPARIAVPIRIVDADSVRAMQTAAAAPHP
ncbi:MAG TPA: substrate-binding domain-containing protein [Gemmatimonadaceae bacterium]|nr:substrate-binding domain-containing protein [Gemmatimonadaceae bacterium]